MPPSTTNDVEAAIRRLVKRQDGAISWQQLIDCGLRPSTITSRRRRGQLRRVRHRVYAPGFAPLSRRGELQAALLAVGDGAVLGGWTALELYGLRPPRRRIDVVVERRVQPMEGIRIRQTRQLRRRDVRRVRRLPVTSVARALVDLSGEVDAWELANIMHEAAYRELLDVAELRRLMRRFRTSHGYPVLVLALELHLSGSAGTRSGLERRFLGVIAGAPIPMPVINSLVPVESGPPIEVDAYWPDARVCVEIDGPGHERARTARDDDARDARLEAAGLTVVRISWRKLEQDADGVRARIVAAVEQGMDRRDEARAAMSRSS